MLATLPSRTPTSSYNGFTTLEVICALLVVTVALLAFEGTATRTIRHVADSHRQTLAATLARAQLERLIASHCATRTGTDSIDGTIAQWSSHVASPSTLLVTQHLEYLLVTGMHDESLITVIPCH